MQRETKGHKRKKYATLYQDIKVMIKRLNLKIVGWRNYYGLSPQKILLKLDKYILMRLVMWYNRKKAETQTL